MSRRGPCGTILVQLVNQVSADLPDKVWVNFRKQAGAVVSTAGFQSAHRQDPQGSVKPTIFGISRGRPGQSLDVMRTLLLNGDLVAHLLRAQIEGSNPV